MNNSIKEEKYFTARKNKKNKQKLNFDGEIYYRHVLYLKNGEKCSKKQFEQSLNYTLE